MSETIMTKAIFKDETAQTLLNKLDAILAAINPVAQGVSYDNAGTGMVANNVQSAITELKTGLVNTNASLAYKIYMPADSAISTNSGSLRGGNQLAITYNSQGIISVHGRIQLQNVEENVRPTITIAKPADMPITHITQDNRTEIFVAPFVRRGSGGNVVSDPCYLNVSSNNIYIHQFNFSGATPAGWFDVNF